MKRTTDIIQLSQYFFGFLIKKKLETESALVKTQNEELKAEVDSLKQLVDCYDIDPEDEQMVTFPHPKASFTSTRTRELNRLSAPSYLNNTQLSKKKVVGFYLT